MVRYYQDLLRLHSLPWNVLLIWGHCVPAGFSAGSHFACHVPCTTHCWARKWKRFPPWCLMPSLDDLSFRLQNPLTLSLMQADHITTIPLNCSHLNTPRPFPSFLEDVDSCLITQAFQHYSSLFLIISRAFQFSTTSPPTVVSSPSPQSLPGSCPCPCVITNKYKCCHKLSSKPSTFHHHPYISSSFLLMANFNSSPHQDIQSTDSCSMSLIPHMPSLPYLIFESLGTAKVHRYNHSSWIHFNSLTSRFVLLAKRQPWLNPTMPAPTLPKRTEETHNHAH